MPPATMTRRGPSAARSASRVPSGPRRPISSRGPRPMSAAVAGPAARMVRSMRVGREARDRDRQRREGRQRRPSRTGRAAPARSAGSERRVDASSAASASARLGAAHGHDRVPGARSEPGVAATARRAVTAWRRAGAGDAGGRDRPCSSSRTSMPTGHQVMQRPQPTQPQLPNWSTQVAELVGQPLAIAVLRPRVRKLPPATRREAEREAASPSAARRMRLGAVEVGALGDAGAEAGRADQRAVGAGQAALGDLGPARAVELRPAAGRAGRRWGPGRRSARGGRDRPRPRRGVWPASAARERPAASTRSRPASRAGAHHEAVVELGQRQVVAAATSGPVPIEVQKQVPAAVGALDRDDEGCRAVAPRSPRR